MTTLTLQQSIDRLEAWADYHHAAAMRSPNEDVSKGHRNQRDNFQAIADSIKASMKP